MALGDKYTVMLQPTYDADANGIVDASESSSPVAIPVLPSLPLNPKVGQQVIVNGKLYFAD